jgi:hypothetical protein
MPGPPHLSGNPSELQTFPQRDTSPFEGNPYVVPENMFESRITFGKCQKLPILASIPRLRVKNLGADR